MRVLRALAAIPIFLLATVLLIVAAVLCVTVLLLPLGIPLAIVATRLYAKGVKLLLPRSKELERGVRGVLHRWTKSSAKRTKTVRKAGRRRIRSARKAVHV